MKTNKIKKISVWILVVLGIVLMVSKGIEWAIEFKFKNTINSNPDRTYNVTYSNFDLGTFFTGVTLNDFKIAPLNPGNDTIITGSVSYVTINGMVWWKFLFGKSLDLNEITFKEPLFHVTLSEDPKKVKRGKGLQDMFADILSRVDLNVFRIQNGSILVKDPVSNDTISSVKSLSIAATDIKTDSVMFKNLIPFEVGNLIIDIDNVSFKPNDYTTISLGHLHYNLLKEDILMNDFSLGYSIDWVEVSNRMGVQKDIIELDIKQIGIQGLDPSNGFYTSLDLNASKVSIDGLNIKLQRNKNISRPPDADKPDFQGLVNSIPTEVIVDTVQISNSSLTYKELGVKKRNSGSIEILDVNGVISNLTNVPKQQVKKFQLQAILNASLVGKAKVDIDLIVPYNEETFSLDIEIGEMELKKLNPILKPLGGVEIVSGHLNRTLYHMDAGPIKSSNKLVFDYSNLHVELYGQKGKHKNDKEVLLSSIANGFIRTDNLPENKKYLTANYQSSRNVYRSPVNYILQGLIHGITRIAPSKVARKLIEKSDKKK